MPKWTKTEEKLYKKIRKILKREIVLDYPISITLAKMSPNTEGSARFTGEKYIIRINRELDYSGAVDTMFHELAHCMCKEFDKKEPHTNNWGICYSRVYRKFIKFYREIFSS